MQDIARGGLALRQRSEQIRQFSPVLDVFTYSGMSGVGKNHLALILQRVYIMIHMIQSVTTRDTRGKGQDHEYRRVSQNEFADMLREGEFQWSVEKFGDWYGTTKKDIQLALSRSFPSMMHLVHERVQELQTVVNENRGRQGVFSFLVICDNEDILRERIKNRQPGISKQKVDKRLQGMHDLQEEWKKSGLYHAVIVNNGDRSDQVLFHEMVDHLAMPIPIPRSF